MGIRGWTNPEDFARMKFATALKRDIRAIPVLVDGALDASGDGAS